MKRSKSLNDLYSSNEDLVNFFKKAKDLEQVQKFIKIKQQEDKLKDIELEHDIKLGQSKSIKIK